MPFRSQITTVGPELADISLSDHWLKHIASQAHYTPEQTAIIHENGTINYQEVEERSNQIALILRENNVGPGQYIGAAFPRSVEWIVSLLGILKTGAAYIPLDPAYPAARIAQMISSARIEIVLTSIDLAPRFPDTRVICTENHRSVSPQTIEYDLNSRHPVYAIFTSGSTGQPKAASVYHSGFANLIDWYRDELNLGPNDRTLIISSPSFDLTQKNLFAPLVTGGAIVLDSNGTYDIARILDTIRGQGVTLINCTPSAFYPLVDAAAADDFSALSSLRFAVLGGEPISVPRLRKWLKHSSCRAEVVNSYGPTECADIGLFHRLHSGNLDEFPFVPLGREIPNVHITIRDENLAPLPDNELGELCISGAGVGGGYLYDPTRTAECFRGDDPVIYRTGDLAKRLHCGTFEFRGRADQQVKINGFRIELSEIEISLSQHLGVCEAVVIADNNRLTAYIQGNADEKNLRSHLADRLPLYMIPAAFHFMEKFPLTPNGKIDRKKLTEPIHSTQPESAPSTDNSLELSILELWSEILERPVHDPSANFFDLGGNSIHIAIVHVRLREMTGRYFPITDLFALPSARSIANHLAPRAAETGTNSAQQRARLSRAATSRFQRPTKR